MVMFETDTAFEEKEKNQILQWSCKWSYQKGYLFSVSLFTTKNTTVRDILTLWLDCASCQLIMTPCSITLAQAFTLTHCSLLHHSDLLHTLNPAILRLTS